MHVSFYQHWGVGIKSSIHEKTKGSFFRKSVFSRKNENRTEKKKKKLPEKMKYRHRYSDFIQIENPDYNLKLKIRNS